jgi:hypothetical protein
MMYVKFAGFYEAIGQVVWFKKFVPRLRVVGNIGKALKIYYDIELAIQYNTPITTRRVMLPSTSILSTMLLRKKSISYYYS